MEKNNFIYKGFDYSFMDDAGKAIMAARIKKEEKEAQEDADSPKGILKEIWERINNHGDYTWLAKRGLLERHLMLLKRQYRKPQALPLLLTQSAELTPNIKNLNIIENEIDKD